MKIKRTLLRTVQRLIEVATKDYTDSLLPPRCETISGPKPSLTNPAHGFHRSNSSKEETGGSRPLRPPLADITNLEWSSSFRLNPPPPPSTRNNYSTPQGSSTPHAVPTAPPAQRGTRHKHSRSKENA